MTDLPIRLPLDVSEPRAGGKPLGYLVVEDADRNWLATVDTVGWLTDEQARTVAHRLAAAFVLEEALARLLDYCGRCLRPSWGAQPCMLFEPDDDKCAPCQARAALREARPRRREGVRHG